MSEIQTAIVESLRAYGGWISPLALRARLAKDLRGEGFDLALQQLTSAGQVSRKLDDVFGVQIYRYVPITAGPTSQRTEATAPSGHARAVADAFHPPPPALRVPISGGADEVRAPRPTSISHAKQEKNLSTEQTDTRTRILEQLGKRPMLTTALAVALGLSESNTSLHLKKLADAGEIRKQGNMRSPWMLKGGEATPPAAAEAGPRRAVSARKTKAPKAKAPRRKKKARAKIAPASGSAFLQDFDMKVRLLEQVAANHPNRIEAFVLREIREDLQRLAA